MEKLPAIFEILIHVLEVSVVLGIAATVYVLKKHKKSIRPKEVKVESQIIK